MNLWHVFLFDTSLRNEIISENINHGGQTLTSLRTLRFSAHSAIPVFKLSIAVHAVDTQWTRCKKRNDRLFRPYGTSSSKNIICYQYFAPTELVEHSFISHVGHVQKMIVESTQNSQLQYSIFDIQYLFTSPDYILHHKKLNCINPLLAQEFLKLCEHCGSLRPPRYLY